MSMIKKLIAGSALMLAAGCNDVIFEGKIREDNVKLTKKIGIGQNYELTITNPECLYKIAGSNIGPYEHHVDSVCTKCNNSQWKCTDDRKFFGNAPGYFSSYMDEIAKKISIDISKANNAEEEPRQ